MINQRCSSWKMEVATYLKGLKAAPRILRPAEDLKGNATAENRPIENCVSPEQIKEKADYSGRFF